MDIIPVLDIYKSNVVVAVKGKRHLYQPINYKLYNSTDPRDIINIIKEKFKPKIIYMADLDAIINGKANHKIIDSIIKNNADIEFWIDAGLNKLNLSKRYANYYSVFCSEKSSGFDLSNNNKENYICSFDFREKIIGNMCLPKLSRNLPKKIILMDLLQVGSSETLNFKILKKFIKYQKKRDFYIAGGIKNTFDIHKAKNLGVKGVLVSSILHKDIIGKLFIRKEKTGL